MQHRRCECYIYSFPSLLFPYVKIGQYENPCLHCKKVRPEPPNLPVPLQALCSAALFAGYFIWNSGNVYFLFVQGDRLLLTLVLVLLVLCWFVTVALTLAQVTGKDLLEQLGKVRVSAELVLVFPT